MSTNFRTIDVCDDIRAGREPFSRIMAAVNALGPEEDLVLIAPFEPVPLFHVLRSRGFSYSADRKPCGDWEVLFSRAAEKELGKRNPETPVAHQPNSSKATSLSNKTAEVSVEIDARGLEPPQPLVRILEALGDLPKGAALHARTDRRPIHLYPQLQSRGFHAETEERSDGSFLSRIRYREGNPIT